MARGPFPINWPLSSFPGNTTQEASGRIINATAEPLGTGGPSPAAYHRQPGLSQFAFTLQSGYRGGLIVNNLSYEVWKDTAATVTSTGAVSVLGLFQGSKHISVARNQRFIPDVVAVDPDFGAYVLALDTSDPGTAGAPPVPFAYSGFPTGSLPQVNSVCFQDSYFFFTTASGQCYASTQNSLATNALTFVTAQSRSDVTLLRGIAFSGLLFLFTTGHCEVWQDVANVAPNFPYARQVVLPFGLLQNNAIAGWETGFDDLSWVAQDFGVWELPYGSLSPQKISPPDLDRLIEAEHRAGHLLEASVYMFAGKKFWSLQSPNWTWEFNLGTQQWNERWSLSPFGVQGRWRGTGGHPAFGKWLLGDVQSGTLCHIDDQNKTELGAPMLSRLESAPVANFPNRIRVARADFNFSVGAGQATRAIVMTVTGSSSGNGAPARLRLQVNQTQQVYTGDQVNVAGVTGSKVSSPGGPIDCNGTWPVIVIDATNIELQGSVFAPGTWTGGGTVTDVTAPPNVVNPQVAISWSDDGGVTWGNPILRSLGQQGVAKTTRITLMPCGISGAMGRKWRLDVSDPVNSSFMNATQSDNPAKY
jgi:hypothetical protein